MNKNGFFTAFRVIENRSENSKTQTLVMDCSLQDAQPGQYVMAWLPGVGEKPFSISGNEPLMLTVADVGQVSHALNQLMAGEQVWVRGPLGKGFVLSGEHHVLVGGGYGAAPLRFLAQKARQLEHQVSVCLGAKTQADLLMVELFAQMGCEVLIATEDGSAGVQGLVILPLLQALQGQESAVAYACGPTGMLLAIGQLCQQLQVPMQLSFEALIRCGVGLCGSCELEEETCLRLGIPPGFLVCHDGPVVKSDIC